MKRIVAVLFVVALISGCAGTQITPDTAYNAGFLVGELGYQFTALEPASRPLIDMACGAATPADMQDSLAKIWVDADKVPGTGTLLNNAIKSLWGMAGNVSTSNKAAFVTQAGKGICDGVKAAVK